MRLQLTILVLGLVFDVFIANLIYKQETTPQSQIHSEVLAYQDISEPTEPAVIATSTPVPSISPSPIPDQNPGEENIEGVVQTKVLKPSTLPSTQTPQPTDEPTVLPTPVPVTSTPEPTVISEIAAPAYLEPIFDRFAAEYGVDKNLLKSVAKCESSFNPEAVNGPYAGMYQYSEGRWIENRQIMGLDPNPELRYNAEEAIKTAAFFMVRGGIGMWPNCH